MVFRPIHNMEEFMSNCIFYLLMIIFSFYFNIMANENEKTRFLMESEGSVLCEDNKVKSLNESIEEIENIGYYVISSFKGVLIDVMYCDACGCDSGIYNVLEVVEEEIMQNFPDKWLEVKKENVIKIMIE